VTWLCPLLKSNFVLEDDYVFYEDRDTFEAMYFIGSGDAAYVLPFRKNIVYAQMTTGQEFGHIDMINISIRNDLQIVDVLRHKTLLKRSFTVQALTKLELL